MALRFGRLGRVSPHPQASKKISRSSAGFFRGLPKITPLLAGGPSGERYIPTVLGHRANEIVVLERRDDPLLLLPERAGP